MALLRCGRFQLDLGRPLVMGIVNVTPDSFSDGGKHATTALAIEHGLRLREEGADILDIGGESTRPGALPVAEAEELTRVIPVLQGLADCGAALSIDTMKPRVMAAALEAGADMVNDVNALRAPGALETVAATNCGICLMHMQGTPQTMQAEPRYDDVVAEVAGFLFERMHVALEAGVAADRLVVDPGFGFGKTRAHNVALFRALSRFTELGPVLVGVSRKGLFGEITGRPPGERMVPSIAAALLAAMAGATLLRVHDVAATVDALKVLDALGADF